MWQIYWQHIYSKRKENWEWENRKKQKTGR